MTMTLDYLIQRLIIAVGLGLLVGLQRESVSSKLAGIRTFPMVTLFGCICGILGGHFGGWAIAAGFVSLAGLIYAGKEAETNEGFPNPGLTTEIAMLLMFGVGAYLIVGYREAAIVVGGGIAVLLHFKGVIHGAVKKLEDSDLRAIMQFALISLVILPVLPNRTYGPYSVLNPRNIWFMVSLIVGISLSGYIIYKFFGERAGLMLGGVLGGVISSTATTVSYSRRTANAPEASIPASLVILISSSIVFLRVMVEIVTVAPSFFPIAAVPLAWMMAVLLGLALAIWFWRRDGATAMPMMGNPTELKSAIIFGLLYALILVAVAFAREHLGSRGLYAVAGLSGLTDVDAITLSTAQMVNLNRMEPELGARLILLATMSNLLFKTFIIALLGSRRLLAMIGGCFGLVLLVGLVLLLG